MGESAAASARAADAARSPREVTLYNGYSAWGRQAARATRPHVALGVTVDHPLATPSGSVIPAKALARMGR